MFHIALDNIFVQQSVHENKAFVMTCIKYIKWLFTSMKMNA